MPRHEFRTIEAFVLELEQRMQAYEDSAARYASEDGLDDVAEGYSRGAASAYKRVLNIVRSSNLGIVCPPAEQGDKP